MLWKYWFVFLHPTCVRQDFISCRHKVQKHVTHTCGTRNESGVSSAGLRNSSVPISSISLRIITTCLTFQKVDTPCFSPITCNDFSSYDHVSLRIFFLCCFRGCGVRIWEPLSLVVFVLWITRFLSLETTLFQNIVFYGGKAWFSKFTSHCFIIMFLQYCCMYWSEFVAWICSDYTNRKCMGSKSAVHLRIYCHKTLM